MKQKHNSNTKTKTRKNSKTYTNKDYRSNDGMITNVWGPALWHYLHTMSFNYPVHPTIEEKRNYRNFIINLRHVLPCKYCRINLKTNFKQLPITMADMKSRETFSRYIYNLHELINKMLNKKSNLSYCDVRERYEHFRSRCTDEKPKIFKFSNFTRKKEKGCTEPLYGKKSKCIINIVPQNMKGETIQIDKSCIKHR
jgi:hypothetical protein